MYKQVLSSWQLNTNVAICSNFWIEKCLKKLAVTDIEYIIFIFQKQNRDRYTIIVTQLIISKLCFQNAS